MLAAIMISPSFNQLLQKTIRIKLSLTNKTIITLLAISSVMFFLYEESSDKTQLFIGFLIQNAQINYDDEQDLEKLIMYLSGEELKHKKDDYLKNKEVILSNLTIAYKNKKYSTVIEQGQNYINFNQQIKNLVTKAKLALNIQRVADAEQKAPILEQQKKYKELYQLVMPLKTAPELEKYVTSIQKTFGQKINDLFDLYEKGQYAKIIEKSIPYVDSDCRFNNLIEQSKKLMIQSYERKQLAKATKKVNKLTKRGQYFEAIAYAKQSRYSEHKEILKLIEETDFKRRKAAEKKILVRLHQLSSKQIELYIKEYINLIKLFPEDAQKYKENVEFYQEKRAKYIKKLAEYKKKLRATREQPAQLITEQDYGEKWPFTIKEGKLECFPPGMITFSAGNIMYALNSLASSSGYADIKEIWRDEPNKQELRPEFINKVDIGHLIIEGLKLCDK
ncbi:MAG: DUF2511 domain-containing protein [Thiomargarita sp.]|nr:DUF2511 domain-containing protein [Thiomargarita sp.]